MASHRKRENNTRDEARKVKLYLEFTVNTLMLDVSCLLFCDAEVPGGEHLPHKTGGHFMLDVNVVILVQHHNPAAERERDKNKVTELWCCNAIQRHYY